VDHYYVVVCEGLKVEELVTETENTAVVSKRPIRVLVVDDDNEICQLYAASLEIQGCDVDAVNTGRQALHVLMRRSIDVLVVDLRMEEMSGLVFLEEALKIWPWLGVVISSAFITDGAVQKAAELGVTRILQKSPDFEALIEGVKSEAESTRREQTNIPRDYAVDLMRNHSRLLGHLAEGKSNVDTLLDALLDFGRALSEMLTCDCISMLVFQSDTPVMLFMPHGNISDGFLDAVQDEMVRRYEALTGAKFDATMLQRQIERTGGSEDEVEDVGSVLSVPVILDDDVCGLLTLASAQEYTYAPSDVSLLYHAANHVSAAFTSLRKMQQLAAMDPLTGVYNRVRLEEELDRAWLFSRRYGFSMAVVVIDIDNFKTLNDSYDHSVGDEVLLEFVRVMHRISRASDIIARYGGDEFVVILPRAEESDATAFANRLVEGTRSQLFLERSYRLKLTVSVGISTSLNPTGPSTSAELLRQADRALYSAKRAGRDRIVVWPSQDSAASSADDAEEEKKKGDGKRPGSKSRGRIMVVDDEPLILEVVSRMLGDEDYEIVTFESANDAISEIMAQRDAYDVVLTDLMMPEKSGIELLRELGLADPQVVKIVMTGYATVDNAISCLREDTYDFIQKLFRKKELLALMHRAVEYRQLRKENERYQQHLEEMVRERSAQVAASLEEVKRSYEFTLEALVAMLDAREKYTGRHSARVQELSVALGRGMGLTKEELQMLASGALLHDIGKIGVPDSVLNRPGKLDADQWRQMQQHPEIGYNIIRSSPYLQDAAEVVRDHHEHYDGKGYLRGLKGDEICLGARIFALIDAYDAIRSNRVYREARSHEIAVDEIRNSSGSQFDPGIVNVFLKYEGEMNRLWNQVTEPQRRNE